MYNALTTLPPHESGLSPTPSTFPVSFAPFSSWARYGLLCKEVGCASSAVLCGIPGCLVQNCCVMYLLPYNISTPGHRLKYFSLDSGATFLLLTVCLLYPWVLLSVEVKGQCIASVRSRILSHGCDSSVPWFGEPPSAPLLLLLPP